MAASLPAGVLTAVVTGQAGLIGLTRRNLSELSYVPLRIVIDVGLTGTVTAFAALRRCPGSSETSLAALCFPTRTGIVRKATHLIQADYVCAVDRPLTQTVVRPTRIA